MGATDGTRPYSVEREFEDLAAVIDTVAQRSGDRWPFRAIAAVARRPLGAVSGNAAHLVV